MLKFSYPYMFWFMFGVIPIAALVILRYVKRKHLYARFFNPSNIKTVLPDLSFKKWLFRYLIISIIYVLIVATLTGPKSGTRVMMTKSLGMDIVLAIDVSNSMMADDLKPNRLEHTKDAISAFLEQLRGDRVGLVSFAGAADLTVELTTDYAAIKNVLPGVIPQMFGNQGTSLSEAIRVSLLAFPDKMKSAGAIIILTDGEDHEGNLDKMIRRANKKGIKIYTIGIGSPDGAKIPIYNDKGIVTGYRLDNHDNVITTKANPVLLKDIAEKGKGSYHSGENPLAALSTINNELRTFEREVYERKNDDGLKPQFQWVLIFVVILMLLEIIYSDKRGKILRKLDI